jgi:hypothetical protein
MPFTSAAAKHGRLTKLHKAALVLATACSSDTTRSRTLAGRYSPFFSACERVCTTCRCEVAQVMLNYRVVPPDVN